MKYKVSTRVGLLDVEGEVFGKDSSIGVHRVEDGLYAVDHVPTGMLIAHLRLHDDARTVAKSIADVYNWANHKGGELPPEPLATYLLAVRDGFPECTNVDPYEPPPEVA